MEPTIQNSDIVFSENLSSHFYRIEKYVALIFFYSLPEQVFVCFLLRNLWLPLSFSILVLFIHFQIFILQKLKE